MLRRWKGWAVCRGRRSDSAQFNFGATGNAAGIGKESLLALARAFKPTPMTLIVWTTRNLNPAFARNADAFDKLRKMAEKDAHVIRIAPDYTLLDSSSKWPREDVGFSEARWDEYRSFFRTLSLPEGVVRTEDFPGAVFFISRAEGLCTGGSSAGYVYSTTALTPITKSPKEILDSEARKSPEKHYAYVFKQLREGTGMPSTRWIGRVFRWSSVPPCLGGEMNSSCASLTLHDPRFGPPQAFSLRQG